jgi:hypothetical protein
MTSVEFEQLLSRKHPNSNVPCIRDLIFNFYENAYGWNAETIDIMTKRYIEKLAKEFIKAD